MDSQPENKEKASKTVEKSIIINASLSKVWDVIRNFELIKKWASAFSEGVYVEASPTWDNGTGVEWKMPNGITCAKGIVTINDPLKKLRVEFYDTVAQEVCAMETGSQGIPTTFSN